MEEKMVVKVEGEHFLETIRQLGLFETVVRICYHWGKDVTYITGKIVGMTPQFIFIKRHEKNPEKDIMYCIALREIIGFREVA